MIITYSEAVTDVFCKKLSINIANNKYQSTYNDKTTGERLEDGK